MVVICTMNCCHFFRKALNISTKCAKRWNCNTYIIAPTTHLVRSSSPNTCILITTSRSTSSSVNQVDSKSKKNGGDLVVDVLQAHGVKFMFTLAGGHISPVLVAAERQGIKVVDTRHEVNAVFAADAVARLTGTVGVAAVTAGPGVTNTITAVKNAQLAESPLLILGGATASLLKGRGALQDIDQLALFKSLCKFSTSITKIRDIVPTLRKAFQIAQSDTPGPVFVELPIDVLYPYEMIQKEIGIKGDAKSISQKIVQWYLGRYLKNLFAGAFEQRDMSPLPVSVPKATADQVQSCAELISKSKRPLLLIGSQAMLPPIEAHALQKVVADLGIPCYLGGMARGMLGRASPIHIRQERRTALKEADLVVLAGAVADFRLSYGRVLNRKSNIISVNRSKEQMLKNSGMFWKPTVAVQADVASFLVSLKDALPSYKCNTEWVQTLRDRDTSKENKTREMADEPVREHLNPIKVLHELEDSLGDNTLIVADGGDFVGSAAYILRPRDALRWLDPGAFGTLGVGGGFALGAKLCHPELNVVIIYGDGSAGYSIMEYDTFRRHKLPVMSVIGNDACWTQISREQVPMFGSNVACQLEYSNYHSIAESLGAKGILVAAKDKDNLKEIFRNALDACKNGHSVLLNVLIGKSGFRDGSISV